jgi:Carboxypeptidase regulatory-like domain
MHRLLLTTALAIFIAGCIIILLALDRLPVRGAERARPLGQPPRPTITPISRPTLTPTSKPQQDDDDNTTLPTGRITGTVIDLTTGAPAPGIAVTVGDTQVTSDPNGNYDRNGLPPGNYSVALVLEEGDGVPAQEPITVELAPGATVILHLVFRSQMLASLTPTGMFPLGATLTPTLVPSEHANMPVALPATGELNDYRWWHVVTGIALLICGIWISRNYQRRR